MPDDINGNATRPPSPIPVTGQDADAPQVNVPIDDIYACLTRRAMRDGRAPLLGNWNVNGYRMTNAGDAQGDQDYVTLAQAKTVFNGLATGAEDKPEPVDADFVPLYDSAAANALKRLTWANIKATLKAYFDPLYIGAGKALLLAGGTMTGKIVLDGPPTADLHATTKKYVDDQKGLCSAWVNFNGVGTAAIRRAHNVSSVVRNGIGDYTINFTKAMPSANYAVSMSTEGSGNPSTLGTATISKTTAAVRVKAGYAYTAGNVDMADFSVIVFAA